MKWLVISALGATLASQAMAAESPLIPPPPDPRTAFLPPLPRRQSPIERFRRLLAANTAERAKSLATATPTAKSLILAKLAEFEKLRPDEREIRLRVAQLQESLMPLLQAKAADREALLADSTPEDQPLLRERLKAWDQLSPEARQEVLDSNARFPWFVRIDPNDDQQWDKVIVQAAPAGRLQIVQQLDRWKTLPPEERTRRVAGFQRFFELSGEERTNALHTLSVTEEQQMEKALSAYRSLSPSDRTQCVQGYKKFSELSAAEREQFLRNATKWQAMTPAERFAWRRIVSIAQHRPPPPFQEQPAVVGSH